MAFVICLTSKLGRTISCFATRFTRAPRNGDIPTRHSILPQVIAFAELDLLREEAHVALRICLQACEPKDKSPLSPHTSRR